MHLAAVGMIVTQVIQTKGQTHFNSCHRLRRKSVFSLSLEEMNVGNKTNHLINIAIEIKQAQILQK